MVATTFAGVNELRVPPGVVENLRIQMVVIDNDIGPFEATTTLNGQQTYVARTRSYQVNLAILHKDMSLKEKRQKCNKAWVGQCGVAVPGDVRQDRPLF
jgi:hypothetical protein